MLKGKTVVLGITGGIAAYKAAELASKLTQAGAMVEVIMTESAGEFITPLTLRNITGRPVVTDMFELSSEFSVEHVALAEAAEAVLIAPATANTIARLACGIADDSLTCTVLATRAPVVLAPSMNDNMYTNPVTQENLEKLKARGFTVIEPAHGRLASGKIGVGRLPDIDMIIGHLKKTLGRGGDLAGRKIVVSAGGTQEPIDPVRVISNRSSGKMGYALAEAARDRGADVILVAAPTALPDPAGIEVVHIETAAQMKEAVEKAVEGADALIMAAAVADYQPKKPSRAKIKKEAGDIAIELIRTPDILAEVKGNFIRVGFAAEGENLVDNARKKLQQKDLDLVVANDIAAPSPPFGSDTNKVVIISRDGAPQDLPVMSKREVAEKIMDRVREILGNEATKSIDRIEIPLKNIHINNKYLYVPVPEFKKGLLPKSGRIQILADGKEFDAELYQYPQKDKQSTVEIHKTKELGNWYRDNKVIEGNKAVIRVIEPMKKYHLEIL